MSLSDILRTELDGRADVGETGLDQALTWEELGDLVKDVLGRIDYENGPAIAQSRLRLFGESESQVRVTLYRDNHAWCPFCQKVWVWLEEKRVPYRVEKVALRCYGQKEPWYLKLVPSGVVPALELDGHIVSDSDKIIETLEQSFGALYKSIKDDSISRFRKLERTLFDVWLKWLTSPNRSKAAENARRKRFEQVIDLVNKWIGETPGPFFLEEFSTVDVLFCPFLERVNATLFYYKGFKTRYGAYRNIDAWFAAMESRESYRGTASDYHTTAHVTPPIFGTCYESGDTEQQQCKRFIDEGPFLQIPDTSYPMPRDAARVCLARSVKHHSSILKQNPHRHGNTDEAFRCALTYLITGRKIAPPPGTNSSLRYIRDRCSCPRDMPPHSAELFRHVCEEIARLDGDSKGTPIPFKHRLDQEPFAFIKAKQQSELEDYSGAGHEAIPSSATTP